MSKMMIFVLVYVIWTIPSIAYMWYRFSYVNTHGGTITYLDLVKMIVGAIIPIFNIAVSILILGAVWKEIACQLDKKIVFYKNDDSDE